MLKNRLLKNRLLNIFVLIVSLVATSGSLYFSEVMYFIPCTLCWYQRILMYPLVLISGVSLVKNDNKFWQYVLPLSLPGMFIAIYHVYLQFSGTTSNMCSGGINCTAKYIEWFGFITIPVLSLTAFAIINVAILIGILKTKSNGTSSTN